MGIASQLIDLGAFVVIASLKTTLLVIFVLIAQKLCGKCLSANGRYLLWLPVVISLIMPLGFDTALPFALPSVPVMQAQPDDSKALAIESRQIAEAIVTSKRGSPNFAPTSTSNSSPLISTTMPTFSWLSLLSYLWMAGVMAVLGAVTVNGRRLVVTIKRASAAPDHLQQLLQECRQKTSCQTPVRLLQSASVQTPMIAGIFKPVLLLPTGLEHQVTRDQLRHVFMHELMHLQRGDIISNWIVVIVQALHWFNPAVWLAFSCMRQDRELACDAATLRHLAPNDRAAYGLTLLQLNDLFPSRSAPANAVGMLGASSHLHRRILMLVQTSRYQKLQSVFAILLLLPLAAVAFSQPAPQASDVMPAPAASPLQVATAVPAISAETVVVPTIAPVAPSPAAVTAIPATATIPAPAVPAQTAPTPAPAIPAEPQLPQPATAPAAAAFTTGADTPITLAALSDVQQPATAASAPMDMAAIQQLATEIGAVKADKIRLIEQWNSTAADCEARSHGLLGNLSTPCRKTRMALARGEVITLGYECHVLSSRHTELFERYRDSAATSSMVENALRTNDQNLATFCSKETYRKQYPAFASMFAVAESLQYYQPQGGRLRAVSTTSWNDPIPAQSGVSATTSYDTTPANGGWGVNYWTNEQGNYGNTSGSTVMPTEPMITMPTP